VAKTFIAAPEVNTADEEIQNAPAESVVPDTQSTPSAPIEDSHPFENLSSDIGAAVKTTNPFRVGSANILPSIQIESVPAHDETDAEREYREERERSRIEKAKSELEFKRTQRIADLKRKTEEREMRNKQKIEEQRRRNEEYERDLQVRRGLSTQNRTLREEKKLFKLERKREQENARELERAEKDQIERSERQEKLKKRKVILESNSFVATNISPLSMLMLFVALAGAFVDLVLMWGTLQILFAEMDEIASIVTAIGACLLAVVCMFEAGSLSTAQYKHELLKIVYKFVWGLIGLSFIVMRIGINEDGQFGIDDQFAPRLLQALLLFVMYTATGLTAYISGARLGHINLWKYKSAQAQLKRIDKKMRQLEELAIISNSIIQLYQNSDKTIEEQIEKAQNFAEVQKKIFVAQSVKKPLRLQGIPVKS
jgi:hypothetical protein